MLGMCSNTGGNKTGGLSNKDYDRIENSWRVPDNENPG